MMGLERLFSVLHISGSGLTAQRKLLETSAKNIAHIETTETESGEPYVPKRVQFREANIGKDFGQVMQSEISSQSVRFVSQERGWVPSRGTEKVTKEIGVRAEEVSESKAPLKTVFEPEHPKADSRGYVQKPNINLVNEMTNMMMASRAYEANVSVMTAAKNMFKKALEI